MERKDSGSDKDALLFRQTVGEVRPLAHDLANPPRARPAPIPQQRLLDERQVLREMASGLFDGAEIETGDELVYFRPGLQHTVMRKLRRGQYAVEAELDLHGCTVVDARAALAAFIHDAQAYGRRCVRIVHGKGYGSHGRQPVLKGKVNHWLRQIDAVLAFCSTRPAHGGTGAVYVLLKRAND
ncbi:MAG: putative DNA endonuclease SmrA [Gammaproteobacteria bacterium]|nr:putative DNA endonuclease SmrA [Gammaproteobacteria bacterium]